MRDAGDVATWRNDRNIEAMRAGGRGVRSTMWRCTPSTCYSPVPREQRWRARFFGRASVESASSSEEGLDTVAFDPANIGSGTAAGDSVAALAIV